MATVKKRVLKNARQSEKKYMANKSLKSEIKTYQINIFNAISNNEKDKASDNLKKFLSRLDKAVKNKIIHKNMAAHKKSKIMTAMNKVFALKKELKQDNA